MEDGGRNVQVGNPSQPMKRSKEFKFGSLTGKFSMPQESLRYTAKSLVYGQIHSKDTTSYAGDG